MYPRSAYRLSLPDGRSLELGPRTLVMGVINVTPDSFSDGGVHYAADEAVEAGLRMAAEGADILDVGGESTRPGAEPLDADEEMRRVLPVVERLAAGCGALLSIDTYKAAVARAAIARGAVIVNDISGLLYEPALGRVAAEAGTPLILMHMRGRSRGMYDLATYQDVVAEVRDELAAAADRAAREGVPREALILDPGFGFAKRASHSFELLARLPELAILDRPLLSGPSRKSFLQEALGERPPAGRAWGTAAAVTASVLGGAHIVRVHDVAPMVDAVRVADRLRALIS